MKQYLVFLALIFFHISIQAQEPIRESSGNSTEGMVFHNNENALQIGFGIPNRLESFVPNYQTSTGESINYSLVYSFSYDRGISDHWSIGAFIAYSTATWTESDYALYVNSYFLISTTHTLTALIGSGRVRYHFSFDMPVDFYIGASLGIINLSESINGASDPDPFKSFFYDLHAGGKYYLNKHVGIFGEIGFGLAYLNGGVCFRF